MKALFLDDSEDRHLAFSNMLGERDKDVDHVRTVEEAVEALDSEHYDVAFLDHDLGGKAFVKEVEGTGTEVAIHIRNMPPDRMPKSVIIHSWNPAGADRMEEILKGRVKNLKKIPFSFGQ